MDEVQQKSYWNAAGMSGLIFGFVMFLITVAGGYVTIHSEPTGSFFSASIVSSALGCLVGAFGGVLAVKFYISEYGSEILPGRGALIGLFAGVFMALVSQFLGMIWPLVDGSYLESLQNAMIANAELMEILPEAQREEMVDAIYTQMQNYYSAGTILTGLFSGMLGMGLLNVLSGLLGAKFLGVRPEDAF